ncbi:MAG: transglutaminase-like domain-containing protein [Verrucomicrobia bacterium]|nr:transglutaminase-like domain-containing protein [Verrucomicrobiota bacterium]
MAPPSPENENISSAPDVRLTGELIKEYLSRRGYSLQTRLPPGQEDPLVRWLRTDLAGHCEFFAGAMVLLARTAGIPARIIVGFHGGDWNTHERYYMVRNRHAHAWVELFDQASDRWLRFDPTPSVQTGTDRNARAGIHGDTSGWMARLDSLRILWYRRVISFDAAQQQEIASSIRQQSHNLRLLDVRGWYANLSALVARISTRLAFTLTQAWLTVAIACLIISAAFAAIIRLCLRHLPRCRFPSERRRQKAGRMLHKLLDAIPDGKDDVQLPASVQQTILTLQGIRYGSPAYWPDESAVKLSLRLCWRDLHAYRARMETDKPSIQTPAQ